MRKIKYFAGWLLFGVSSLIIIIYFGMAVFGEKQASPLNITLVSILGILNLFAWGEYVLKYGKEEKK